MDLHLKDKIAIVGGASQGIGYSIAHTLAMEGATVVITARRKEPLLASARRIAEETGARAIPVAADLRTESACQEIVGRTLDECSGVDILVNNAGAPPLGPVLSFDDAAWERAVEQNLLSVIRMIRQVVPSMEQRGGGSILNITAISAIQPIPQFGLSVATWSAVIGLAKTLALELAAKQIKINTICPGYINTPRLQKVFAAGDEPADDVQAKLCAEVPLGRIGTPQDIANLVALLVSPRGSYITGTTTQVDGGLFRATR